MGGSSKSATTNENSTNNVQTESGVQIVDSDGASIVMTDYDAVELSLEFAESTVSDAFSSMENTTNRAFSFGEDAIDAVDDANERIEVINNRTIGTLKDFAETLSTGDLKTTKTIYLAGVGIIGAVVVAVIVLSGNNKKKASK